VYYLIDPRRGRVVLKKLCRACFNGVLVTDFWGACNSVTCLANQKCLPHLPGDLSRIRHYHNPGGDWLEFYRRLRRLIRDGMRLKKDKHSLGQEVYERRKARIRKRLDELIDQGKRKTGPAAAEKTAAPPGETAYLPRSRGGAAGQQRRGEGDRPRGPDPEEQLRQWQRVRGPNPGHLHDHPPHPQDAWAQPGAAPGGWIEILRSIRATAALANKNHGIRLKGYIEKKFQLPLKRIFLSLIKYT
jgi:hypothetical protein